MRLHNPFNIYVNYERDTLYFTRWNSVFDRLNFIKKSLEEYRNIKTIETVAFDLDYPQPTDVTGPLYALQIPLGPIIQTFILVLPTDGSEESNRKEKKLVPCTIPTRNTNQDILHNWEKFLYGPETPHILKSFEALEIDMRTFWERKKSFATELWVKDGTLRWAKECIDCKIPTVKVMKLVDQGRTCSNTQFKKRVSGQDAKTLS